MKSYFGKVGRILRWPVKSLRGEELPEGRFDERGLAGDRAYALVDERDNHAGRVLTVRQRPELLHWSSAYGTGAVPTLTAPDGTAWAWDDPALPETLAHSLGTPLSLRAADGQQDRGPTVLVTVAASLEALGEELGAPVDLLRFRPNLHLDLVAPVFAEESWAPRYGDHRRRGQAGGDRRQRGPLHPLRRAQLGPSGAGALARTAEVADQRAREQVRRHHAGHPARHRTPRGPGDRAAGRGRHGGRMTAVPPVGDVAMAG